MTTAKTHGRADRRRAWLPPLLLCSLCLAICSWWIAAGGGDAPPADAPPRVARSAPEADAAASAAAPAPTASEQPLRTAIDEPSPAPAAPAPTFEEYVARLVELGVATSTHVAASRLDEARASDEEARATMADLLAHCPDSHSSALAMLVETPVPADDGAIADRVRRRVLHIVLDAGLQRLSAEAASTGARAPLDALVAGMLTALPSSTGLAHDLAHRQLIERPWLGLAHEDQVLELVALAGQLQFDAAIATALLATLWHNLGESGSRSSEELAALALLFLGETNPSKRATACRLLIGDPRYRGIVLEQLRRSGDPSLAREVAMAAARDLTGADAVEVLAVAAPLAPDFTSPFLTLAMRDPACLQQAYEQRLAGDQDAALREQIVAGLGFSRSPQGVETARLAFDDDPSPSVRLRALFVLSAAAADSLGEAAFRRALADPALRDDPRRVDALVLALENFAHADRPNTVDRLGRELLAVARLSPAARADLERILARSLPTGTPTGAGR